ncbi:dihydropteroate synthase [Cereibacter azotoformans]|uniref:dihydropteroate synthase n=1 Tax=Cereibacter azotoformans TaxID=43057 RepID=UPI001EEC4CC6|nr:dihydropteroate synthase [Cereibacter azotoformans]ULB08956.1 dihydropteroate synthase [Cereibacter azotoformans]
MHYVRPIPLADPARPEGALPLAGGPLFFDRVEILERGRTPLILPARELDPAALAPLTAPRPPLAGLSMGRPRVMGILNVTPDSFSDGGRFAALPDALAQAQALASDGADILDIGGESTRPGAAEVDAADEISRTAPVIEMLRGQGLSLPVSIDTRKAAVAEAALQAGADLVNDVAALTWDVGLANLVARSGAPVCLMHAQGTPQTMQADPRYDDVLLDVYDWLAERIRAAEAAGIPRSRIVTDPGIGFGKTLEHNLAILRRLSLFHGLGCPILLGASRKRFIGTLSGEPLADRRMGGSVAVALAAAAQGAQILRVHDVRETRQALVLWRAVTCEAEEPARGGTQA